jgi:hypothetical protein
MQGRMEHDGLTLRVNVRAGLRCQMETISKAHEKNNYINAHKGFFIR